MSSQPKTTNSVQAEESSTELETELICHHTSPLVLPLLFKHGLYLSAVGFTTFRGMLRPSMSESWLSRFVAIMFRASASSVYKGESHFFGFGLGNSERVVFPPDLREALLKLDTQFVESDRRYDTSQKPSSLRIAVRGAHNLLAEEKARTLRHFGVETFDIAKTREANRFAMYRSEIYPYLDALEKNGGKPVVDPVPRPGWFERTADNIRYHIMARLASRQRE